MTMTTKPQTIDLDLSLIDEPSFDSRLLVGRMADAPELRALGESLKVKQLEPIVVEGPTETGRYIRVAGGRRVRAARLVDMTTLRAEVWPLTDDATRALNNTVENVQRKDLSTYELARACVQLREMGVKAVDAAKPLGLSKQRVSNLTTALTSNPPEVVKAWELGDETLDDHFLGDLARHKVNGKPATDAQKMEIFKARREAFDEARATGLSAHKAKKAAKTKTAVPGSSSAKLAFSEKRFFSVKAAAHKLKDKRLIQALDYIIQQRKSAPDGMNITEDDEKKDAAK